METEILIKKCLKKDRRAQNELYKSCHEALMTVCWRYANSEEDALYYFNTGFVKIIFNLKKYKKDIPFDLWIRRVMINNIIDEYRKSKLYKERVHLTDNELWLDQKAPAREDTKDYNEELLALIHNKIKLLPPVTSKVFNLYAIDGFKHREIAEMLSISEGTSQWHYSVAKQKLKLMLGNTRPTNLTRETA